ncbi:uncharacterized protein BDZ99DRAFT_391461 [Mytilinidion resinicola]|uniref:RNA polymerase II subunit A C-terminal domain phosphatase n=1 Tax=Mytilinidion resinicola TaxID=574789 RepID=A0A6A6YG62_9PEZI|nr:uncharacterized protein BDZ99DRAFT_391461 [Mytilinidion resinicola]KAF2807806.1 hypothetical protein BDZ99DRAFT_391461 [Mytilinidion resinicola]
MLVESPTGLHYPITVVELAKKPEDDIQRGAPLFSYYYETTVTEGDKYGDEKEVKKKFPAGFESSKAGTLTRWFIQNGTVIQRAGVKLVEIDEPCTHETQFAGMCADCGKDMTEEDYMTDGRDVDRATVNMTHDNTSLLVSKKEALLAEEDAKRRLLGVKKLSLIVDLDQTVIHTTCERTIAEWQNDPNNPNYDAVKEVRSFQLADDRLANVAANWYYCKLRPGLKEFLDKVSTMYELHIYTMATRAYAQAIAKIIDPDRVYFGDRILSRDENGTDQVKTLHRLFPVNTDMVLVIDDRGDIWHWSDNLVKVRAYNFFLGAGDINASFLPKQVDLITDTAQTKAAELTKDVEKKSEDSNGEAQVVSIAAKPPESILAPVTNGVLTDLEKQLLTMSGGDNPDLLERQTKEQEKVIISQQTERPLLQKQLALEQAEETAEAEEDVDNADAPAPEQHKHKSLLHDDDDELIYIEACLRRVHRAFFDEYQKKRTAHQGGRIAELRGEKSPKKRAPDDLAVVPDIKTIMPRMKRAVLQGVSIVFSGIVPLGMDVQSSDIALWAKSFGAQVTTDITKQTTHVVANPSRKTTKVKRAANHPQIKIVTTEWLLQCFSKWERADEQPYLIQVDPAEHGAHGGSPEISAFDDLDEGPLLSAEDDGAISGEEDEDELKSPVNVDISEETWQSLGDEFQEFMDESDDDDQGTGSDTDSVNSENSVQTSSTTRSKKKRKRGTGSVDGSEADDSDASVSSSTGSKLQRKKKRVLERVTSLTNVVSADKSSGLPSPETTGPDEGQENGLGGEEDDDDGDAELEAELLAELERDDDE